MPQRTKWNNNKFASYLTNCWETASCVYLVWPWLPSVERLLKSSSLSTPVLGQWRVVTSVWHTVPPQHTLTLHPHDIITVTASPPLALCCFPCSLFLSCRSVWLDFPLSLALCLNSPLNPCSAQLCLSSPPPLLVFLLLHEGELPLAASIQEQAPTVETRLNKSAPDCFFFFPFFFAEQAAKPGLPRMHLHKHPPTVFTCYGGDKLQL